MEEGATAIESLPSSLLRQSSCGSRSASAGLPYFVYEQAIVFEPPAEVKNAIVALFLAVIEFNMALTFHLQGLQLGTRSWAVTKALTLYDFSLEHIKHSMDYSEASNVLVAALSNKAQLLSQEMMMHEQVTLTVAALSDAVAYCHRFPGIFAAKDVEEFQLNLLIFNDLKFAQAA